MTAAFFVGGLLLLVAGAELLVRGASRLAAAAGISPLVIGLTVVAFGTSAPELAVSVKAALTNQADLAVGNVVGSNTFNVLCILGLSALIAPLAVSKQLVRFDVPVMIGTSVAVLALASDGTLSRAEGFFLLVAMGAYIAILMKLGRQQDVIDSVDTSPSNTGSAGTLSSLLLAVSGLVLLVVGSQWFVDAAVSIATAWGVSPLVIGLTIVAAGTSLPELVTSVIASLRNERDIAVGNVVGSNIFNLLCVLGAATAVAPEGAAITPAMLRFDLPVMLAVALVCLPIFFTGLSISRGEGAVLLFFYVAYVGYLVLAATQHAALPAYSKAMLWFVLPIGMVAILVPLATAWRQPPARRD
ncbi:calcium/sodium antiporter [Botrimarina hoheduenensis]|uniref:Inner membrane protein YrbG n=1 Tax=Botrimarina hoheduenensis TaxID=2528000 RepID=A0A5C5W9E7_9BACT|nr:calcium/sodium antiporter [Botrimarina hoheduenensis]TWT46631.1 Inner membrane protein YrbG [Botrimarina hoheduenensis]